MQDRRLPIHAQRLKRITRIHFKRQPYPKPTLAAILNICYCV